MDDQNNIVRVALITGGSRGIGAAIALRLADDGYDIAISYAQNKKAAQSILEKIKAKGRQAIAIQANGESVSDNIKSVVQTVERFGQIDALICNAGSYPFGSIEQMNVEQIEQVLNLNVRAVMVETAEAVKHLQRNGRIIYIGSAFGARSPFAGISLYSATKAALEGFARGVARDVGPKGITVNVVEPGPIDTDLNPENGEGADLIRAFTATQSYGKVTNIADFVAFLVSPEASYITGASLPIDGGLTA